MRRLIALAACAALLAACAPDPSVRNRDTTDGGALPKEHPQGIVSSFPPYDNSFTPLRCLPNGEATVCSRDLK